MKIKEPKTYYFNTPLLNVNSIQLSDMWFTSGSYLFYCDAIDSNFSLCNFNNNDNQITASNLIGIYPKGSNAIFKTNKSIISKLTITVKNIDLTKPANNIEVILNLKIYHDLKNEQI